jgi:hypothetical protein
MSSTPLWADEAETSINALTILQHGVPRDRYLGLPIFENTFSRPWPESREYQFKDTSYSDKGLAIYHGWLPLYALAASFALYGVEPDEDASALAPRHSVDEMRRRTRAARTPALIFGTLFLVFLFLLARELYGIDAGWAALTAATVSTTTIAFARQARYYSSTLMMTTLCCLLLCLMVRRGRWRDFAFGGAALALLFHTHLFAFLTLCVAATLVTPLVWSQKQIGGKALLFAGITAVGTAPWVLLTGFLSSASDRPMARSLLSIGDVLQYPLERLAYASLAAAVILWLLVNSKGRNRSIPARFTEPFISHRASFFLIAGWAFLAFLIFVCFVPAASYFYSRLTLIILVPSLLFGAMLCAAAGRVLLRRQSSILAAFLFVVVLFAGNKTTFWPSRIPGDQPFFGAIESLGTLNLQPGVRLYTESSENLILRFYTGMPFQNIMPVRKAFLDSFNGEVLILEAPWFDGLEETELRDFLDEHGESVSMEDAVDLSREAAAYLLREGVAARGAKLALPERPPHLVQILIDAHKRKLARETRAVIASGGNPMFKGYDIRDYRQLWQVFFFRFVDPEAHMGINLNYADRIRGANASILPGGWALLRSPAP